MKALNEDILVVIQNDSTYSSRVPIALGTCHIDMVIEMQLPKNYEIWGKNEKWGFWVQRNRLTKPNWRVKIPPMIDQIDHDIKLSQNITIQPRKAMKSMGIIQLPVLFK